MGKRHSNKGNPKIQLPKDALKRVSLGQSFAEYDKVLMQPGMFVRTPAAEAALNESLSRCFFVGRRGTGKTALTYHLQQRLSNAVHIHPQAFAPLSLSVELDELRDTRQRPFRSVANCFQRALLDEALAEWSKRRLFRWDETDGLVRKERNYVEDYGFDARLLAFVEEILAAHRRKNEKEWLKCVGHAKRLGTEMVQLIDRSGHNQFLLIDRVDEYWDGSDKAVIFLMGMMHACVELAASVPCVRPLLFLRENIFERVRQVDNEFARLETCVVSMDWTEELLLELVERRLNLPFTTRLAIGGPTWDYFFEQTATQQSSRSIVFQFCQRRPRDVLTYCSFAIDEAKAHLHERVKIEDLQAARRRFSDSRLKDLGDEYAENYPQLQIVLSLFYGLGTEFTVQGIDSFLKKLLSDKQVATHCSGWIYNYTSPDRFIHLLYDIGFFGIKSDNSEPQYRSLGPRSSSPPPVTQSTLAVVHPSYVDALELRACLIGTLDDAVSLQSAGILLDLPGAVSLDGYRDTLAKVAEDILTLPCGPDSANTFEELVGQVIRLCFFRSLTNVEARRRDSEGRVIRDWVAANRAESGFWEMVRLRYNATQVIWECKNYSDLGSDDFQQAAYYMTDAIGKFVIIAFRGKAQKTHYGHIRRIAGDKGGIILLIGENDLRVFVRQAMNGKIKETHIHEIYDQTVREISQGLECRIRA